MPLLVACNRVGGKESDSSERTARHWLYVIGCKKSYSIRRRFTVPSSIFSSCYSRRPPGSSCLFVFAPSLFVLGWSCVVFLFALHRVQVYRYGGALNYWCLTARRETTKKERRRWTWTDPVISEKSFPRHSVHHWSSRRSFSLSSACPLLRIKQARWTRACAL